MVVETKEMVLSHLDLSWNKGEFEALSGYMTDDFFYKTTFTDEILNTSDYLNLIKQFRQAMPNLLVEVDLVMSDENHVMTKISFFGTVIKEIYGIPASDKVIAISAMSIWSFKQEKIVSLETLIDLAGLERQLAVKISPLNPLAYR